MSKPTHLNPLLIGEARIFAEKSHGGQFRKNGIQPYFTHPSRVAAAIQQYPNSTPQMVAAAYLHDVVEDCGVSIATIEDRFGK